MLMEMRFVPLILSQSAGPGRLDRRLYVCTQAVLDTVYFQLEDDVPSCKPVIEQVQPVVILLTISSLYLLTLGMQGGGGWLHH